MQTRAALVVAPQWRGIPSRFPRTIGGGVVGRPLFASSPSHGLTGLEALHIFMETLSPAYPTARSSDPHPRSSPHKNEVAAKAERGKMLWTRGPKVTQQNKQDRYALPKATLQDQQSKEKSVGGTEGDTPELTLKDVMEAITGVRISLEQKMDSISVEVKLIRADLTKLSEKVKQVEITTASLVDDTSHLQNKIQEFTESKLDDYEGRTRQNNI